MRPAATNKTLDVAIVGAGAAGLATAIFAARQMPERSIVLLDGVKKIGAKILASGGGRCNVTNRVVTPADFNGGSPHIIRRALAAFSVEQTITFFRGIGVALHEEECGKLFPDANRARTVLEALLNEEARLGVQILAGHRVSDLEKCDDAFRLVTNTGTLTARQVVLATGGLSLPKTGSDGGGYALAQKLGHSLVPTTPALVPLVLDGDFHVPLAGVSHDAELIVHAEGRKPVRIRGSLLWTHFGVSGPVALDASRHWHRARLERRTVSVLINFHPGEDFDTAEQKLLELAASYPKLHVHNALARRLPARVAEAVASASGVKSSVTLGQLSRDLRRRLLRSLLEWPLPVRDSRGYNYAEVTAGGVPLSEIDPRTMASRRCPGLYLVGEILAVDGRIGGFNFQWAWSSACAAADGLARHFRGQVAQE